jgi:trehalose-6-phosphate synthase
MSARSRATGSREDDVDDSDLPAASSRRRAESDGSGSGSSDDEIPAADDDEDLETTLAHMKQEHAQHLEQFNEQATSDAAAGIQRSPTSSDPTSPPVSPDARRQIYIIAKSLPCHLTNVTGLATPTVTPGGSPVLGPIQIISPTPPLAPSAAAAASSNLIPPVDMIDGSFSLDSSVPSLTPSPVPGTLARPRNSFDRSRRPSLSGFSSLNGTMPRSSVVEGGGSKWRVEWEDSRSFLSNLRCLLTPSQKSSSPPSELTSSSPALGGSARAETPDVHWIGMSSITAASTFPNAAERASYESALRSNRCIPVFIEKALQENYNSFCKSILWPLLHYMMPTNTNEHVGQMWQEYWDSYQAANMLYADALVAEVTATPDNVQPVVWIHGHYLFSLPRMIRERLPRATIGLFIHTPFPSSDVFRSLPSRKEILEAMMESDLLGFHTFDYARHFLSCIKRVLDLDFETLRGGVLGVRYNGRFVSILISHVGIQASVFEEASSSEKVRRRVEELRAKHSGKKIIIGVDDVDVAKGPLLKLQAFDRFLSRHPEWVPKVVILEMFLPSKNMDSELGVKIQQDLDEHVALLRSRYGDGIIEIVPPFTQKGTQTKGGKSGLDLPQLVRLYSAADVAIISTFFDGLNLIPFECTASQGPHGSTSRGPAMLVISEFMGCSRSLNGVLRVNPWSLEMISDALHQALNMTSDERRANHARRYNYVRQAPTL